MKNRINGIYLESDMVYPNPSEFDIICKVDKKWLIEKLYQEYGTTRISNKYVIEYKGKLYYNHDNSYYLIEPVENPILDTTDNIVSTVLDIVHNKTD